MNKYQDSNLSNRKLVKPDCACPKHDDRKIIVRDDSGKVVSQKQNYRFRPVGSR